MHCMSRRGGAHMPFQGRDYATSVRRPPLQADWARCIAKGRVQAMLAVHSHSTIPPTHPHAHAPPQKLPSLPARQTPPTQCFGRPPEPTSICVTCCLGFAFDPPLPFPPSDTVSRPHPPTLPPTYPPICTPCSHHRQELRRSHQQQADSLHQLGAGAWVWGMGVGHQIP